MAKVTVNFGRSLSSIAKGKEVADALEPVADRVMAYARRDPNEYYVSTLRKKLFVSPGRLGRVSWQVGAEPTIGVRVEAKRGTLARALGMVGF
jgi:hypothetical protein